MVLPTIDTASSLARTASSPENSLDDTALTTLTPAVSKTASLPIAEEDSVYSQSLELLAELSELHIPADLYELDLQDSASDSFKHHNPQDSSCESSCNNTSQSSWSVNLKNHHLHSSSASHKLNSQAASAENSQTSSIDSFELTNKQSIQAKMDAKLFAKLFCRKADSKAMNKSKQTPIPLSNIQTQANIPQRKAPPSRPPLQAQRLALHRPVRSLTPSLPSSLSRLNTNTPQSQ